MLLLVLGTRGGICTPPRAVLLLVVVVALVLLLLLLLLLLVLLLLVVVVVLLLVAMCSLTAGMDPRVPGGGWAARGEGAGAVVGGTHGGSSGSRFRSVGLRVRG